jgi:hypothetical protein
MTIAEIHGKLSPDRPKGAHERMEDLLTSDVFSTMKYAGWHKGFMNWLLKAEPAPIIPSPKPISDYLLKSKIVDIKYSFWPKLANNREPDVALLLCFDSDEYLLVLIEAKYFSGTSNWEGDQDDDQYGRTGNQIADQVTGLIHMYNEDLLKWFPETTYHPNRYKGMQKIHLFITMNYSLPDDEYEYAKNHFKGNCAVECYWLSWRKLAKLLEKSCRETSAKGSDPMLSDLYELLQYKDLVSFEGFSFTHWQSPECAHTFWNESWWNLQADKIYNYQTFWNGGK